MIPVPDIISLKGVLYSGMVDAVTCLGNSSIEWERPEDFSECISGII